MPGKCARCSKAVYFAEEKLALGKSWHKMCFKCSECNKLLDSTNVTQRGEDIYCKTCYGRLFGPKGYGYGGGSGVLSMDGGSKAENGVPQSNVSHVAQAYAAPKLSAPSSTASNTSAKFGGAVSCRRCGKSVYAAEKVMAGGGVYHKACLTCFACRNSLQLTSISEHDSEVYCKACYGRNFGPKGYGYGIGAGCLQSEAGR